MLIVIGKVSDNTYRVLDTLSDTSMDYSVDVLYRLVSEGTAIRGVKPNRITAYDSFSNYARVAHAKAQLTGRCDERLELVFSDNEVILKKFNSIGTGQDDIVIPNYVTIIDEYAFKKSNIRTIQIPDSVHSIRQAAFCFCEQLEKVDISYGLRRIHSNAFLSCSNLQGISLPNSIVTVNSGAFSNCYGLSSIVLPSGLKKIENNLFAYSTISHVTLPKDVECIDRLAFFACENLRVLQPTCEVESVELGEHEQALVFPKSIKSIGQQAFQHSGAYNVIFENGGITELKKDVFACCHNLRKVVLPDTLKKIGAGCFQECVNLGSVNLTKEEIRKNKSAFTKTGVWYSLC